MTRLRKLRGFTLIELIVVVIIIGVLSVIATVAYNQFVGNSKIAAAKADAKQLVNAVNAYAAQNTDGDATKALGTVPVTDKASVVLPAGLGVSANSMTVVTSGTTGTLLTVGPVGSGHTCTVTLAATGASFDPSACA